MRSRADGAAGRAPAPVPVFLVFAACAFASGFALRLADPIVLPVAAHFAVTPRSRRCSTPPTRCRTRSRSRSSARSATASASRAASRSASPGSPSCCCSARSRPSFALLLATRIGAGIFAGGLIPLVLAGLGDTLRHERAPGDDRPDAVRDHLRADARLGRLGLRQRRLRLAQRARRSAPASARSRRRSPGSPCRPARARRRAATAARSRRSTAASSPIRRRPG